jgi:hypothetical protein
VTFHVKHTGLGYPELKDKTALAMPHPRHPGLLLLQFDDKDLRSEWTSEHRPEFIIEGDEHGGLRWGYGWHAFGECVVERLPKVSWEDADASSH